MVMTHWQSTIWISLWIYNSVPWWHTYILEEYKWTYVVCMISAKEIAGCKSISKNEEMRISYAGNRVPRT
jgi:hypothetical protein